MVWRRYGIALRTGRPTVKSGIRNQPFPCAEPPVHSPVSMFGSINKLILASISNQHHRVVEVKRNVPL